MYSEQMRSIRELDRDASVCKRPLPMIVGGMPPRSLRNESRATGEKYLHLYGDLTFVQQHRAEVERSHGELVHEQFLPRGGRYQEVMDGLVQRDFVIGRDRHGGYIPG